MVSKVVRPGWSVSSSARATATGTKAGLLTGGFVWLGFVVTVLATNYGYQQMKPSLTLIDGLHWLGVLLIQGAVIGAMG